MTTAAHAGGHRQHRVHHLQFARPPDRQQQHRAAPTNDDAMYLTDGTSVYGVTVAATGFIRTWRTNYASDATMDASVSSRGTGEQGTTILEVVVASAILVTLMAGLMSLAGLAISTTENQGHLAARTTEYAQDKMEQLMALAYGDARERHARVPGGERRRHRVSRSAAARTRPAPVALYVDYLDQSGNLCGSAAAACRRAARGTTPPTGWFYKRVWQIEDVTPSAAGLEADHRHGDDRAGFGGAMQGRLDAHRLEDESLLVMTIQHVRRDPASRSSS